MLLDNYIYEDEQFISSDHAGFVYPGSIDFSVIVAPCFIYAGIFR